MADRHPTTDVRSDKNVDELRDDRYIKYMVVNGDVLLCFLKIFQDMDSLSRIVKIRTR